MSRPLLQLVGVSLPIPRAPLLRCMFEGRDPKILLRCIPPHTLATWLPPFSWSTRCSQAALSFGLSASLILPWDFRSADSIAWYGRKGCCPSDLPLRSIPPTALRLWAPPAYGRGWPGSSGQNPYTLQLQSIPPAALRLWAPLYGRVWPGSSGQHPLAALALQINPPRGPNRAQRSPSFLGARPTCKTEGRPNAL